MVPYNKENPHMDSTKITRCGSIWMLHDCAQGMTQATDEQYFVSVDAFERLIKKNF